jgi:predicted RecB family nuclease
VEEDNLSLLRGLGAKEVKGYSRKGLFTLPQLAHTFRPRRKGKRSNRRHQHRYHALQALAIRDKRVYVLGTPEVPTVPVQIYLDMDVAGRAKTSQRGALKTGQCFDDAYTSSV